MGRSSRVFATTLALLERNRKKQKLFLAPIYLSFFSVNCEHKTSHFHTNSKSRWETNSISYQSICWGKWSDITYLWVVTVRVPASSFYSDMPMGFLTVTSSNRHFSEESTDRISILIVPSITHQNRSKPWHHHHVLQMEEHSYTGKQCCPFSDKCFWI